jgi:predicted metal-dependent phosphoesterase TrpH
VAFAAKQGVEVLALTDHDTVSGIREAREAADREGIQLINGIEFSAKYEGELHILGYNIDDSDPHLGEMLQRMVTDRQQRVERILARLREEGMDITLADVPSSPDGTGGRMHIARAMVKKGFVHSIAQAFEEYLRIGAKCYVRGFKFTAEEIISAIHQAGGQAVLAHPMQLRLPPHVLKQFIESLVSYGLDGIEAYYPSHSEEDIRLLNGICQWLDLFPTCGSDFHGMMRDDLLPGQASAGYEPDAGTLLKLQIRRENIDTEVRSQKIKL